MHATRASTTPIKAPFRQMIARTALRMPSQPKKGRPAQMPACAMNNTIPSPQGQHHYRVKRVQQELYAKTKTGHVRCATQTTNAPTGASSMGSGSLTTVESSTDYLNVILDTKSLQVQQQ